MPTAIPPDRAEEAEDGSRFIDAPGSKGWRGPEPPGPRRLERAGTAVLWDGEAWEVVETAPLPGGGGVRYRLVRWDRTEAIRDPEPYPPPDGLRRGLMAPLRRGEVLTPGEAARRRDLYHVRVPFLALLPAEDQERLRDLYGFDPVAAGRKSVFFLLAFAALQVMVSRRQIAAGSDPFFPWTAIGVAVYVAVEQVVRLVRFSRGQAAGSALGVLVRPFARVVLPPR